MNLRSSFQCMALVALCMGLGVMSAEATEEAEYDQVLADGPFEIREYAPQIVAEVRMAGSFKSVGNDAFWPLFKYIDGANQAESSIAMTAPVTQSEGQKIAMTAPVSQQLDNDEWVVSFMMPAKYTMETIPKPTDERVSLRAIPTRRMAVMRYSGSWSEKKYQKHLEQLTEWVRAQDLQVAGAPEWARYNAPFSLWFVRRNEVMLPLEEPPEDS